MGGEHAERSVMLTHSPRGWSQRLHFHLLDHGGAVVAGYALSELDIVEAMPDAVIVDDICSFASRTVISNLAARGISVLGVFDPIDGNAGQDRLTELGVDRKIAADAPAESFLALLPAGPPVRRPEAKDGPGSAESGATGTLVVVAAAGGGAGATEVAAGLAGFLARGGRSVALVDADETTPSLAARFGLPLHPNLRTAVAGLDEGKGPQDALVSSGRRGLSILTGLPSSGQWQQLRAGEVVGVVDALVNSTGRVVVNIGARIEDLHVTGAPPRYAIARALLPRADVVVLVGLAGPIGIIRIADWLSGADRLVDPGRLYIVMNRFPGGGFRSVEMVRELARVSGAHSVRVAPHDSRVDRAVWQGRHVRRGPFARRVKGLARDLVRQGAVP